MSKAYPGYAKLIAQLEESQHLSAVRRGFLLLLPLVMIGAVSLVLGNLALPESLIRGPLPAWQGVFLHAGDAVFGLVSLCLTMTVSHSLAAQRQTDCCHDVQPMMPAIVALLCFLVLVAPFDGNSEGSLFGPHFVFPSLLVAIGATEIFLRLAAGRRSRWGWIAHDADPIFPCILHSFFPAFFTIGVFLVARLILGLADKPLMTLFENMLLALFDPLQSGLARALLFNFISQLLWFVGIHGNNVLAPIEQHYFQTAEMANAAVLATGGQPVEVFTKSFLDIYVFMGGSGTSLALLIAIFIHWRGSNQNRLARVGLAPALFNVSELAVFGLPVIFNPAFLLPFIVTPLALTIISYFACASGWIPVVRESLNWTTPFGIGGYLAAQSWHGAILQFLNLFVGVLIYSPFVRAAQKHTFKERRRDFQRLLDALEESCLNQHSGILERRDPVGSQARRLANDLRYAVSRGEIQLMYQPQVDQQGSVVGLEALLRWEYGAFGRIPPNIVIALAEEANLICRLGDWVIDEACGQLRQWRSEGVARGVVMSINISPTQLNEPGFADRVLLILSRHALPAGAIELEITESRTIAHNETTAQTLEQLARSGIRLAIDDFGMGYSSLLYMRRFVIHGIKLDGSLTREVQSNPSCQEIIRTIAHLCRKKNIRIIAEFVENEEQRTLLEALGCSEFQGFLFSKPLPPAECADFVRSRRSQAVSKARQGTNAANQRRLGGYRGDGLRISADPISSRA